MKTAWPMWPTGWAAARTASRALEIMKDSRVGAFGAIAVVLALLAKVALLALLGSLRARRCVCGAVRGPRGVAHLAAADHSPAAACGRRCRLQIQAAGGPDQRRQRCGCFLWCFMALAPYCDCEAAIIVVAFWRRWCSRPWRFWGHAALVWAPPAGFTGDCLGATQQVCEMAFYLGLAVGWGLPHETLAGAPCAAADGARHLLWRAGCAGRRSRHRRMLRRPWPAGCRRHRRRAFLSATKM